ncbi:MAG: hypothetical protein L6R28_14465 [Planctomycetes bacterium]|nr:hypothetical protein [Planctomycetota bacterium]
MDWLVGLLGVGGGIVIATIAFFTIVVGLPVYLHHRRLMAKMQGVEEDRISALKNEVAELRKRCETLERDILVLHEEMADETRVLDRKLSSILPGDEAESEAKTVGPAKDKPVQGDERVRA